VPRRGAQHHGSVPLHLQFRPATRSGNRELAGGSAGGRLSRRHAFAGPQRALVRLHRQLLWRVHRLRRRLECFPAAPSRADRELRPGSLASLADKPGVINPAGLATEPLGPRRRGARAYGTGLEGWSGCRTLTAHGAISMIYSSTGSVPASVQQKQRRWPLPGRSLDNV
jgi:hypothetical protein